MKVCIILGSYNGLPYIRQQIESIQRQSFQDWHLIVRDDASTDGTVDILREYSSQDSRISILEDQFGRQGVVGNFGLLLQTAFDSKADYVFLCDQDDVWDDEKLATQLEHMKRVEAASSSGTPVLVYSDLSVVDDRLGLIHPSYMKYQKLYHEGSVPMGTLLVQNFVTGSATAINRPLLELALPFPRTVIMHDWWLALCAAASGKISYIDQPLVWYRQHRQNVIGAKGFRLRSNIFRQDAIRQWSIGSQHFSRSICQVRELQHRLQQRGIKPVAAARDMLEGYCRLFEQQRNGLSRLIRTIRLGVRRQHPLGMLILAVRIMFWCPDHSPIDGGQA